MTDMYIVYVLYYGNKVTKKNISGIKEEYKETLMYPIVFFAAAHVLQN